MPYLRLIRYRSFWGDHAASVQMVPLVLCSVAAIAGSFIWAATAVSPEALANGFGAILALYLGTSLLLFFFRWRAVRAVRCSEQADAIERILGELDAAASIAGSIRLADIYRLIAHHVHPLLRCSSSALMVLDDSRSFLRTVAVNASAPSGLLERDIKAGSLAAQCFAEQRAMFSNALDLDFEGLPTDDKLRLASAAIPLFRGSEIIAVVQFFFDRRGARIESRKPILDALADRISTLVVSAMIYERNIAFSMKDPLVDLPNYYGFLHVLEDHIAHSTRPGSCSAVSVLSVDVRNFDQINKMYGHAVGDTVLRIVASSLREALRTMDLIARDRDDEFLILLPNTDQPTAKSVVERIESVFNNDLLNVTGVDQTEIKLNIGSAVLGSDGLSARSLIARARLRKDSVKSGEKGRRVVMFPKI